MNKTYKLLMTFIFTATSIALAAFLIYRFVILGFGLSPDAAKLTLNKDFDKNNSQYRFSYTGEKNKNQIIHLNKGKAVFKIFYKGDGNFRCELKKADGTLLSVLGTSAKNYYSSFSDIKTIEIPEENPYILSVVSDGKWDISNN